jgi:uncharacterized protein (TIGR02452 family)
MGRTEKSQGLAPPAVRKDVRAKQAKHMINKTIPALLASSSRASKGVESSELIVDPAASFANTPGKPDAESHEDAAYIKRKGQGRRKVKHRKSVDLDLANLSTKPSTTPLSPPQRKIRILTTDTLTAAHMLAYPSRYGVLEPRPSKKAPNICILNMASPLRPGGGVLTGATSQEEFLCARTTLLPSLQESYYRLPEFGGIWSPDVLVFHTSVALGEPKGELAPSDRYWIDVISAGMLRFPELEGGEDEVKRLSKSDRGVVEKKMRAVLRIAEHKGARKIVLGAWGCGAYGNPVGDVARAWRRVLDGSTGSRKGKAAEPEMWPGLEEVVFAIGNRRMAADFAHAFDDEMEVESGPSDVAEDDEAEEDEVAEELRTKIRDMESQLSKVWNADLKARMGSILNGLKEQLKEREGGAVDESSVSEEDDDD